MTAPPRTPPPSHHPGGDPQRPPSLSPSPQRKDPPSSSPSPPTAPTHSSSGRVSAPSLPPALNAAPHDVIRGFPPKRSPAAHTGLNPGRAARRHGNTRARPPQRRSHWSVPPRPGCCGAALKGAATPPKDDPRVVAAAGLRDPRRCPRRGAVLAFAVHGGGGGRRSRCARAALCLLPVTAAGGGPEVGAARTVLRHHAGGRGGALLKWPQP